MAGQTKSAAKARARRNEKRQRKKADRRDKRRDGQQAKRKCQQLRHQRHAGRPICSGEQPDRIILLGFPRNGS